MGADDAAREVLSKVGVWWPAADEDKVRAAADAWRAMATALDSAAAAGTSAAGTVEGVYRGSAADAFSDFWHRYGGGGGYLPQSADACRQMASMCDQFADAIAKAKEKLVELAAEIGATVVVGTALAIFTFGASEAAAAAASASLIAAAGLVEGTVAATIAEIAATALTFAAIGAVEGAALDVAVAQPLRVEVFHDGGYSFDEVEGAALGGAVFGGAFAGAGRTFSAVRNARALGGRNPLVTVGDGAPRKLADQLADPHVHPSNSGLVGSEYRPFGDLSPEEFAARYRKDGDWDWPPDAGAVPGSREIIDPADIPMDRIGGDRGSYFGSAGDDFGQRAVPPDRLNFSRQDWHIDVSRANAEGLRIERSTVAPWFEQPGGGTQFRFLDADGNALSQGELRRLDVISKAGS